MVEYYVYGIGAAGVVGLLVLAILVIFCIFKCKMGRSDGQAKAEIYAKDQ